MFSSGSGFVSPKTQAFLVSVTTKTGTFPVGSEGYAIKGPNPAGG
jgi:hypothetical protein